MKKNYKGVCIIFVFFFYIFYAWHAEFLFGEDWWHVYFTLPGKKSDSSSKIETPETAIIRNIKNANKSVYGAFFEINSRPIIKELLDAHKRGIDVRLVLEKDYSGNNEIEYLKNAGIKIVTDNRKGLMHNKFAVIDGEILWTGSYNLTYNDEYKNNNNVIEIHSKDVSGIYLDEFNEMFDNKIFGNKKEHKVFPAFRKKYYVKIGDTDINVYFSPEDNIEKIIIERIGKAKHSIHFMGFSFTSKKLAEEIIRLNKKGIKIYGIIEKTGSNSKDSQYIKLKIEGTHVKLDKNRNKMHHKVIIIDESIIITGSYNFSLSANEKNDENIVILHNKDISRKYIEEFFKLFE
jgi:phosphatidylserine/phosphatidylglycerophosphate/cardiolipin synthase-like enzyme